VKRWPLIPIAAPAAVAIWSGWVGLGQLCGFGLVQPLPGIVAWHLNTAITLPIGVEAYGAYALGAWLTEGTPERARAFARNSAVGALVLGMLGQVVYHLLAAAHATRAPWPVVVLVSCLPVVTLGFGAALTHLLRSEASNPAVKTVAPGATDLTPEIDSADASADTPDPATLAAQLNGHRAKSERVFAADIAAGRVPGIRRIQQQLHVGQPKARLVQEHLRNLTQAP
jgi:hypothetical protein